MNIQPQAGIVIYGGKQYLLKQVAISTSGTQAVTIAAGKFGIVMGLVAAIPPAATSFTIEAVTTGPLIEDLAVGTGPGIAVLPVSGQPYAWALVAGENLQAIAAGATVGGVLLYIEADALAVA